MDITVVAAKGCHNRVEARMYAGEDVLQLRNEQEMLSRYIMAKATMCQEMAAAMVVSSGEGSESWNMRKWTSPVQRRYV